jgi:hypothetical protein
VPLSTGDVVAIGIGLGNIAAWSKIIYDSRKNAKNGNGSQKQCPSHIGVESRMSTIETEKEGLTKELQTLHSENRQDHGQIFTEIKNLAVAVSVASEAARTAAATAAAAAAITTALNLVKKRDRK